MRLIVGKIGEQSLIDVEDPSVLTISSDLNPPSEAQRVIRDGCRVGQVPVAGHVVLDEGDAPGRNAGPGSSVVGLDGESPAVAVEVIVRDAVSFRRHLDDGLG